MPLTPHHPLRRIAEKLRHDGEPHLADTLLEYATARRSGAPIETLRDIWLRGDLQDIVPQRKRNAGRELPAPIDLGDIRLPS